MLAAAEFSAGQVGAFVAAWIVTHAITGVVTGFVTLKVLEKRVERMDDRLETLERGHQECQLDARERYAPREELTAVTGRQIQQHHELVRRLDEGFTGLHERIDETHGRITQIGERVSAVEERTAR